MNISRMLFPPGSARSKLSRISFISLLMTSPFGSEQCILPRISRASCTRSFLYSHLGLSGNKNIVAATKTDRKTGKIKVNRHDAEFGCVKDMPNATHIAIARPISQNIPNAETCSPRLSARDTSDCQTDMVAIIPPVPSPSPSTIRATINWPSSKAVASRIAPIT